MDKYFFEVFESSPRQGPGSSETTRKAYSLLEHLPQHPEILDIGCGGGTQTIDLARLSAGKITAVDINKNLLQILQDKVNHYSLQNRVKVVEADMAALNFRNESYDLIWAEGSIYNIGVETGIKKWKEFLKPGGYMVFTEAVYFKTDIPEELKLFWDKEYPDITWVEDNINKGISNGLELVNHFPLPNFAWKLEFYNHIEQKTQELREKYSEIKEAQTAFNEIMNEIAFFDKYHEYYGYEFYIFRK